MIRPLHYYVKAGKFYNIGVDSKYRKLLRRMQEPILFYLTSVCCKRKSWKISVGIEIAIRENGEEEEEVEEETEQEQEAIRQIFVYRTFFLRFILFSFKHYTV